MVAGILRDGFVLAHRRLGLIFLDFLWKAVWLAITMALLLVVAGWFGNHVRSIEWQGSDVPGLNGLIAATLVRQFWNEYGGRMFWALIGVFVLSALLWIVLEAFFRARILAPTARQRVTQGSRPGLLSAARFGSFPVFLLSNIAKVALLSGVAAVLVILVFGRYLSTALSQWPALWIETRGATMTALVIFLSIAFFLTVIQTLVRSDAVELFGTDLIRVSGVIGILLMFEALIGASIVVIIVTGFLNVSSVAGAIAMLGVTGAGALLQSLLHSYLLLVRFSAVDIMRRNVVEV